MVWARCLGVPSRLGLASLPLLLGWPQCLGARFAPVFRRQPCCRCRADVRGRVVSGAEARMMRSAAGAERRDLPADARLPYRAPFTLACGRSCRKITPPSLRPGDPQCRQLCGRVDCVSPAYSQVKHMRSPLTRSGRRVSPQPPVAGVRRDRGRVRCRSATPRPRRGHRLVAGHVRVVRPGMGAVSGYDHGDLSEGSRRCWPSSAAGCQWYCHRRGAPSDLWLPGSARNMRSRSAPPS